MISQEGYGMEVRVISHYYASRHAAAGQDHGPCRCYYQWGRRDCEGEDRGAGGCGGGGGRESWSVAC